MVIHRCIVYGGGTELFQEEGHDLLLVAAVASERVRAEYPLLTGVEWQFERIVAPAMPHVPNGGLEDWDEHIRAYRAELEANDG